MSDIGAVDFQPLSDIHPAAPLNAPGNRNGARDRREGHARDHDADTPHPDAASPQGKGATCHVLDVIA